MKPKTKQEKPDCPWNHGKLSCCERIVCELQGDDVSPDLHTACLKVREEYKDHKWKDIHEEDIAYGLARKMVNAFWDMTEPKIRASERERCATLSLEKKALMERNEELEKKIKELCKGEILPEHWKAQGRELGIREASSEVDKMEARSVKIGTYWVTMIKKWDAVNNIRQLLRQ